MAHMTTAQRKAIFAKDKRRKIIQNQTCSFCGMPCQICTNGKCDDCRKKGITKEQ